MPVWIPTILRREGPLEPTTDSWLPTRLRAVGRSEVIFLRERLLTQNEMQLRDDRHPSAEKE